MTALVKSRGVTGIIGVIVFAIWGAAYQLGREHGSHESSRVKVVAGDTATAVLLEDAARRARDLGDPGTAAWFEAHAQPAAAVNASGR